MLFGLLGPCFITLQAGICKGVTLDQQFIKLTYFSTSAEDQNRKVQEAWLSLQLRDEDQAGNSNLLCK
jgi:membrane carboxypeptidase/penicillin-binding protein